MNRITENIRTLRRLRNLSQVDMANKLNMTIADFGRIEKGHTAMSDEMLLQISETIGYSIDVLQHFDPDMISLWIDKKTPPTKTIPFIVDTNKRIYRLEQHIDELFAQLVNLTQRISATNKHAEINDNDGHS